ncbi:MAG: cytochrome-c peroxidase [Roseateles sp.]|nr:MAG: cytochrome-c peroxidase [Roseateles sp.]
MKKCLCTIAAAGLLLGLALGVTRPGQAREPERFYATRFERQPDAATLTELGRQLFHEPALSASGRQSCASCHDPAHAYGPPNALAVQLGGPDGRSPGLRAVPSLMYKQTTPPFSRHFYDSDGDDSQDQGPTGGFNWDGRASSAHEQAAGPLMSPFEMANTDRRALLQRLQRSPSAAAMRAAFGERLFEQDEQAWRALLLALEVFQQNPADFAPYRSKYDDYLRGRTALSPAEARGLALFNDANKGNCASCHPSGIKRGAFPLFTDLGHISLGVPRNPAIPANRNPRYRDLGLCGPLRQDLAREPEFCGLFKTPTLRNVATRQVFFHNGVMTRLEDAVRFYAERDTRPAEFYPVDRRGRVRRTDDLPQRYQANLNTEPPFGGQPGDPPVLSAQDVADLVAFLHTLTDAPPAAKAP